MSKKIKRELIEWGVLIIVVVGLYLSGWHTEVLGTLQRGVLATGIIRPDLENESISKMDYGFSLQTLQGEIFDVNELKGEVVFVNLWATWCPPCIAEMPDIHQLYQSKGEKVEFLMISLDDDPSKAAAFIERKGFDFPVYSATYGLPKVLHSNSIPTSFVINRNGDIVVKRMGLAKYNTEEFKYFLDDLISQ
jgi:thiol-disulfide isomerase/thioredoxin